MKQLNVSRRLIDSSSSSCDFTLEEQALIEQYRRVPDEILKKLLRDQLKILSGNN